MRYLLSHERLVVVGIATSAIVSGVYGSSDFYNNNNNHGLNNNSPYFYSEIRSVDFPIDNDENDSTTGGEVPAPPAAAAATSSSSFPTISSSTISPPTTTSIVASSLLYEGGCVVSSQAMMCSTATSTATTNTRDNSISSTTERKTSSDATHRFLKNLLENILGDEEEDDDDDQEEEENDNEDNDDNDHDDGHSSMLSNAFVRRSKARNAPPRARTDGSSGRSMARSGLPSGIERTMYLEGEILLPQQSKATSYHPSRRREQQHPSDSRIPLLSMVSTLRGGSAAAVSSDLSKKLINSAIVTLIFEACIGHILEFFKIVLQTSPPGTTYASVYRDITNEKGIGGLWDGFLPWGVLQSVLKGGVFGLAYAVANTMLKPLAMEGTIPMKLAMALSGGIAGGFQGYVLSPTLLMKTRVMTNEVFRESMSVLQTTWKSLVIGGDIIKTEGLGSLMKGANTFATKRVFDWASRYYFADLFEALFVSVKGSSLSVTEQIIASLLGGIASTVLTLPLDVLVAKTQDAKKAGVKVSAWKLFSDQLEKEGWVGLRNNYMKGFEARLVHVCLTTVVMKTIEPIVYDRFFKA